MTTLLLDFASGDPAAAVAVNGRYRTVVERIARRLFVRAEDREDAVQEAFVKLWRHGARHAPHRGSEATFVDVLCRRALIDFRRREQRRRRPEELLAEPAGDAVRPDDRAGDREHAARALAAIAEAPAHDRRLLEWAYVEGVSSREIARRLRRPLPAVRSHLRRASLRLRAALAA